MATTQPIALPAAHADTHDYPMGSYSADHGRPFNPASYTRHFLGSPISWRAASLGARFENKFDGVEGELCRNYSCCGIKLPDLHALLEHFEDVHVLADPAAAAHIAVPFHPQPFDPDDMELELDLDNNAPSPSPSTSPPSPGPAVRFPNPAPAPLMLPEDVFNTYARFAADYSSHMPGTQLNASTPDDPQPAHVPPPGQQCIPPALLFASASASPPPASKLKLKVRPAQPPASASTPATPASTTARTPFSTNTVPNSPSPATPSHTPHPTPSLLLSKPFRCPKPNCNKSYKQANGLKYHMTHGSCNFAPPKDLEHVKDLLERKRREREASGLARSASLGARPSTSPPSGEFLQLQGLYSDLGLGQITETELRDIEREAEKRLKPFACGVGDCQRRYKNMNGLRYHYQHSGDHGALGLALLAGGLHECLGNNRKEVDNASSTGSEKSSVKTEEREGRRRVHQQPPHAPLVQRMMRTGGSASVPVSRATSVVANSRVGTPSPMLPVPVPVVIQKSISFPAASTTTAATTQNEGTTTPFTPGYTNPVVAGQIGVAAAAHTNEVLHQQQQQQQQSSPPMTPLTAAVQGMGLASQPHSPPHPQQQLAYQAQFVELQRRQYLQMQAQVQVQYAQQQAAQQQQQYAQQQQYTQDAPQIGEADADAMAQQEFVEAQRREFEFQQQQQMGLGDVVMG
ncbi:hypothetical protein H2248_001988 [Termitomyces sp. 'cryptogamus']|nr:hypothetical protein H2248_001988 [Termitomyces sp. 'cryptogamus']